MPTYAQFAKFCFDRGNTTFDFDLREVAPGNLAITRWGAGGGMPARPNDAQLDTQANAATWWNQFQLDQKADSDRLGKDIRALVTALVTAHNALAPVAERFTEAQVKTAYLNARRALG